MVLRLAYLILLHPSFRSLSPFQNSIYSEEDTHAHCGGGGLYNDEGDEQTRKPATGSTCHVVSSSSGGSGRQVFPQRNPGGDGIDDTTRLPSAVLTNKSLDRSSGPTPSSASVALNHDYGELYQSHQFCKDVSERLTDTQNQLVDALRSRNILSDDHKILQQAHLGCVGKESALNEKLVEVEKEKDKLLDKNREQEERIKRLEEALASKTSSLSEAKNTASTLKGNLEHLTVDLSQAEVVRQNYVRQLLTTVVQRLLSSDEYKKSLSDVFNQAIAAGWSEGVKVKRSDKDVEAILATVTDYGPECKYTFLSAFDGLLLRAIHMWRNSLNPSGSLSETFKICGRKVKGPP
ncbi:hypothetical protein Tco_0950967 [Tanacetum coccineum]|uniref:FRIGIDA-like protein n=1 Tax=Tanacetum coccineum TaxID=301880 RepID=A0ABQ5DST9_9ASTR